MILAWQSTHLLTWTAWEAGSAIHVVLFLAVATHCLLYPRDPRSTLSWLFATWALPVLGALLYLIIGINRVREKGWQKLRSDQAFRSSRDYREQEAQPLAYWRGLRNALLTRPTDGVHQDLNAILNRIAPDHPLLGGNALRVLVDADKAFPEMFAAMRAAQHHIHLQSFIIGHDETGRQLLDTLAERAAAGVQVRLLYDEFGSAQAIFRRFFHRYAGRPNLQIVGFSQASLLKHRFRLNLRNHRKVLVVDGTAGFTGGMNFHDVYLARDGHPPTHDYHFGVAGPAVLELQYTFLRDWYYMTDEAPERLLAPAYFPHPRVAGDMAVRLLNNGPTAEESESLMDALFAALNRARRQVLIVTPYFVPPEEIRRALRGAALRGVEVKILVPAVNNHRFVGYASQALYDDLLACGVRIFEHPPPFLHGKALVVDDSVAVVGSANLDACSLRLNYESNLVVFDAAFAAALKRVMLADFAPSTEVTLAGWRTRSVPRRLKENFCSLLSPIA